MKFAWVAGLLLAMAPAVASADHRHYDRGDRYYRGGRSSRSSIDFSIGFGSHGYRDYSYARFGYSSYPRYYHSYPRYSHRPVYVAPPVYYAPPVVYRAPVYVAPPVYAPSYCAPSYYDGGYYARPRAYYYSTGSYYCR